MPEQTSAGSGSFLQYLAGNLRRNGRSPVRVYTGFVIAWALFFLFWTVLPPFPGLTHNGMAVLGIVLWASVMWVSEAMPTGITGISIPTLLLITQAIPWQGGKPPMSIIFAGFTNHVIWLCLFAFLVGAVMQLVGLDKRIALGILARLKASSVGRVIWGMFFVNIVLGFLVPAANARAATLLPVVQGICRLLGDTPEERAAKKAIVIQSLVYGSMICGMFIMTAHLPNMIMVGIFDKAGFSNLNYLNWMLLQAPYLGMFALTQAWIRWHFGTRKVHIAGGVEALQKKYDDLGPMTMPEKVLLGIFALAGIMFMTGKGSFIAELHHQPLGVIGLLGMLVLFAPGLMPLGHLPAAGRRHDHDHGHDPVRSGPVAGRPHPRLGGGHELVAGHPDHDGGHAHHPPGHALQRGGRGHTGAGGLCHGAQAGPASRGLHHAGL